MPENNHKILITLLDILSDVVNGEIDEFKPSIQTLPQLLDAIENGKVSNLNMNLWDVYKRKMINIIEEMDKAAKYSAAIKSSSKTNN